MVEDLVLVVAVVLAVALGYLLGLAQAKEELAPLLPLPSPKESELHFELVQAKAQGLALQSELESVRVALQDSELELVRVKQKAHLKESELEMALDLARVQGMTHQQ